LKDSPLSAAINNTPKMFLAHMAPKMVEAPPALTMATVVADTNAPFTEAASALNAVLHDYGAAERRSKERSRDGHVRLVLDVFKSTCGG